MSAMLEPVLTEGSNSSANCCRGVIIKQNLCQHLKSSMGDNDLFDPYNVAISHLILDLMATAKTKYGIQFTILLISLTSSDTQN